MRRPTGPRSDEGFTLIEVIVALLLIGIVMGATTSFFVATARVTSQQRTQQIAAQVAESATERVRALTGSEVVVGRDTNTSTTQWTAGNTDSRVSPFLAQMQMYSDSTATSGSGTSATLPTVAETVKVNGVPFNQSWYVGKCWQAGNTSLAVGAADCTATSASTKIELLRVVVVVTWTGSRCTTSTCAYVTVTLISAQTDPAFTT
jgi:prepilin-type N-terminal cleavage/methylation domain-containing protein